jgi:tetratricopeptide (TPR) repeat protein
MIEGLIAGLQGDLEGALEHFRKSLVNAKHREDKIRAYQFLTLTTSELEMNEAALGFCTELVEYVPEDSHAHAWRADILALLGRDAGDNVVCGVVYSFF